MKTIQQLIDRLPEDVTFDEGFRLVDSILCSKSGKDLQKALKEGNLAHADIILRLHMKVDNHLQKARKYIMNEKIS